MTLAFGLMPEARASYEMFLLFRPYLSLVLGKVRDNLNIDAQSRPEIFLRAVFLWYNKFRKAKFKAALRLSPS